MTEKEKEECHKLLERYLNHPETRARALAEAPFTVVPKQAKE